MIDEHWITADVVQVLLSAKTRNAVYLLARRHQWRRTRHGKTVRYNLLDVLDTPRPTPRLHP